MDKIIEELKGELSELIDKLANAKDNGECGVTLEAIDKVVWLIYMTRIRELTS